MSRHSFLRSASWMLMAPVLLCSSGCWDVDQGPRDEEVCGFLGTFVGIKNAYVDVYPLDEITGRLLRAYPVASTLEPTDENGEFCMTGKDSDITGMLLFVARGGEVREYWSDTPARLGVEHLSAVVEHWTKGRPLSITPWTTLSYKLAKGRYRNGEEETFYGAVLTAEELVYEHFIGNRIDAASRNHCSSMLNCLKPALILPEPASDVSPDEENYTLTLLSLSALAAERAGPLPDIDDFDSVTLTTKYLALDAIDGRFDGFEMDQPLETTVNTLRSEIAQAFAVHGPVDSSYLYANHNATFERMALNTDPRLFGSGEPEPIDSRAPTLYAMSSPIFDERDDHIEFDADRIPNHIHNLSSVIPLESVFSSDCPEIHKHVNLLSSTDGDMNPLKWRFTVRDEVTGIAEVRAEVSVGPSYKVVRYADVVMSSEVLRNGGYEVVVTVTANNVPEILTQEGEFRLSVIATDKAGNESVPLEGCWHHVPRSAPLWIGPVIPAGGPDSIVNYTLEDNNLSPILNGSFSSRDAPILASFEAFNPSTQVTYLIVSPKEIFGQFAWNWNYHYELGRREQHIDSCIRIGKCTSEPPQPGYLGTPLPNPAVSASGVALTTVASFCDGDCSGFPIPIEPGASVTVHLRWLDWKIMLPEDVSPGELDEHIDPFDQQRLATGTVREYIHCVHDNGDGTCAERQFYTQHITMRAALLDIRGVISGKTFAAPTLSPRQPVGRKHTFGTDNEFSQSWDTVEN